MEQLSLIISHLKFCEQGHGKTTNDLPLVMDLLQKPKAREMVERGAVLADGKALLDTGIFIVRGAAFSELVEFALLEPNPVADILATGDEVGGLPLLNQATVLLFDGFTCKCHYFMGIPYIIDDLVLLVILCM